MKLLFEMTTGSTTGELLLDFFKIQVILLEKQVYLSVICSGERHPGDLVLAQARERSFSTETILESATPASVLDISRTGWRKRSDDI